VHRRPLSVIAAVTALSLAAGACSRAENTTAVDGTSEVESVAAPTSTIVRATTPADEPAEPSGSGSTSPAGGTSTDPTAALISLVGQVASDPALAAQLGQLDAVGIANLLGIDLSQLSQLGLTPDQIAALAESVVAGGADLQGELTGAAPDPAVLLGLLVGSLDVNSLADGTISTLVQGLLAAITGTRIVVSPELVVDLGELLGDIDPETIGPLVADPSNASLIALLTSAWLGSNPLLTRQLLANPALDPALRQVLEQLSDLSNSLGETARATLLEALYQLFPNLDPTR
jgi:hypothetical protein